MHKPLLVSFLSYRQGAERGAFLCIAALSPAIGRTYCVVMWFPELMRFFQGS